MRRMLALAVMVSIGLPGCAHRARVYSPDTVVIQGMVLDAKGKDRAQMVNDGNECAAIAQSTAPEEKATAGAVAGAIGGALLGALIFRSAGLSGNRGATFGAGAGGLSGAANGAAAGAIDYRTVLRNCMVGRGHMPLN